MSLLVGAILALFGGIWIAVDEFRDRRDAQYAAARERAINRIVERERPTDDEWMGFALSTNPDNQ